MKRLVSSLALIVCLAVSIGAGQQKTGILKGKLVTDKGKPIAGATIRCTRNRDHSVKEGKTDANGLYRIELEPDDYSISFEAEGFQGGTLHTMEQVEEGQETEVKLIHLGREHPTSLIRGSVFTPIGQSIAGARVKLVRVRTPEEESAKKKVKADTRDYVTNTRGEFTFRVPSMRARYMVSAKASGFTNDSKIVDVNESEAVAVALTLDQKKKK